MQTKLPSIPLTQPKKRSKGPSKEGLSFTTTYMLSGTSACIAESFVYPCDVIKTRLQTTEISQRLGMFRTGLQITQSHGLRGIYLGFTAACYRHLIYSGFRYLSYELLRENVFCRNEDGSFPIYKSVMAAMSAGVIGQFIASPTDLFKVQMQTKASLYNYSTWQCMKEMTSKMGIFGLWRGWLPNVQRAAFVQLGDLTAYDIAKQNILFYTTLNDNFFCHGCASFVAGFVSTVMSTPSDVLKTRIMCEPHRYKSTTDCLIKTVRNDGFFALWRGFLPIWSRMAPKAMIFYLSFEQLRSAMGLSSW